MVSGDFILVVSDVGSSPITSKPGYGSDWLCLTVILKEKGYEEYKSKR